MGFSGVVNQGFWARFQARRVFDPIILLAGGSEGMAWSYIRQSRHRQKVVDEETPSLGLHLDHLQWFHSRRHKPKLLSCSWSSI